jgi:energy-coupling factor transport system permease protein
MRHIAGSTNTAVYQIRSKNVAVYQGRSRRGRERILLKFVPLGTYYPGQSLLHSLQARTKLLLLFWLVVWLTIANHLKWHLEPYGLALVLLALGLIFARISPRALWQKVWLLVLLMALGAWPIVTATTTDSPYRTLLKIGPFGTSYGALRFFLLLGGVISLLIVFSAYLPWPTWRLIWRKPMLRFIRRLIWLLALAGFLFYWLYSGPPAGRSFPLGPVAITDIGVWALITFSSFLLLLYAFSLLLTMTTSPMALIEGVSMLLAPLRRLKLPVDSFALMTLLALRFFPTLLEEFEQLNKAQTARGADLSSGTLRERFQSLTMLFIPLIHAVLRQASELGTALEARGYLSEGRQTALYETTFQWRDYIVLACVVVPTVAALIW